MNQLLRFIFMYLARLEIYGFKTFAQKVDLHFNDGITNIVGPNGCGKSNIVDALRWALGEQKMSVLRSEKLENVIFNGTSTRKPLNVAEVSVTVHNTKNILPVEYSEVKITRRIYRSGESEYYLNNMPCRLKDINDLLMDTGMGADAYSVIELKMVEQILSDNTEDRRRLFEEAAGITKYKQRRKQTLRKLDETRADLTRVNDIITEIEKNVNSLKRQTQKAKRYQKLEAQLKYEDIRLAHFEYHRFLELMRPLEEKLSGLEAEAERQMGEIALKESDNEELYRQLIEQEQTLRKAQEEMESTAQRIEAIEKEMLVARERRNNYEDLIRRYSEENTTLQSRKELWENRIQELNQQYNELQEQLRLAGEEYTARVQEQKQAEQELNSEKTRLEELRKQLVRLIDEMAKSRNQYQLAKNNIQNLERKIRELETEIDTHKELSGESLIQIDEKKSEQRQLHDQMESLRVELSTAETAIEENKNQLNLLHTERIRQETEVRTLQAQIELTRKAIESHEGFPESVRHVIQSAKPGITGTVADDLSVDDQYKKAIEALLGDSFACLIAGSESTVLEALHLLAESDHGHAAFLNIQDLPELPEPARQTDLSSVKDQICGLAADLIHAGSPRMIGWLLGDAVIVENFDVARQLAARYPHLRWVTLQGEIVQGKHYFKGGSVRKSTTSLIGQKETLRRMQNRLTESESALDQCLRQIQEKEQTIADAESRRQSLQNQWRDLEQTLHTLDKAIAQSQYEHRRATDVTEKNREALQNEQNELARFQEMLAELEPLLRKQEEERTKIELDNRQAESRVAELEKQLRIKTDRLNQITALRMKTESEVQSTLQHTESLKQQIKDADETVAHHKNESRQAEEEIRNIDDKMKEYESTLIELSRFKDQQEKERDRIEQTVSDLRERNTKMESELKKLRRQREEGLNSRHQLEQQVNDYRYEIRSILERIQREYEFDLTRDSLESLKPDEGQPENEEPPEPPNAETTVSAGATEEKNIEDVLIEDLPDEELNTSIYDPEAAKGLISEIRRKIKMLGLVNMEAFAEYEKEKERLDILVNQRHDLLEAEKQLMETIQTINSTAQKQFMETFEKIRQNFIRIFTSLFEESDANLELAKDEDPLEANIEIYARPTGKKVQLISQLSGGEKTMTAIALLFAIYLVKPSPFCVLDEVDAPLDDQNIDKFTKLLKEFSSDTQFIVVTHNKRTMEMAANIFGITMQEKGVSKVVAVKFKDPDNTTDDITEIIRRNQVADLTQDIKEPPMPRSE